MDLRYLTAKVMDQHEINVSDKKCRLDMLPQIRHLICRADFSQQIK
jgi:hypothetical protein